MWSPRPFDKRAGAWSGRSEEHTSELQSLMRSSYAVFCLKKKSQPNPTIETYMDHLYYNKTPDWTTTIDCHTIEVVQQRLQQFTRLHRRKSGQKSTTIQE